MVDQEFRENCYKKFAENLPMLRGKLRLSQEDLANIVGVSRQTITMIENKKHINKWSMFMALMFVFYFNPQTKGILECIDLPFKELKELLYICPSMDPQMDSR